MQFSYTFLLALPRRTQAENVRGKQYSAELQPLEIFLTKDLFSGEQ